MGDDVAIRIPSIRRMLGDHRSPHFLMPLNDNLSSKFKSGELMLAAFLRHLWKCSFISFRAASTSSCSSLADMRSTPLRKELSCTRLSEVATRTE